MRSNEPRPMAARQGWGSALSKSTCHHRPHFLTLNGYFYAAWHACHVWMSWYLSLRWLGGGRAENAQPPVWIEGKVMKITAFVCSHYKPAQNMWLDVTMWPITRQRDSDSLQRTAWRVTLAVKRDILININLFKELEIKLKKAFQFIYLQACGGSLSNSKRDGAFICLTCWRRWVLVELPRIF